MIHVCSLESTNFINRFVSNNIDVGNRLDMGDFCVIRHQNGFIVMHNSETVLDVEGDYIRKMGIGVYDFARQIDHMPTPRSFF